MDVILLEKIERLGGLGDKVSVRPGYARNFLIPQGKAKPATADNLAEFEARREELEKQAAETLASAKSRQAKLADLNVVVTAKSGTEGKLFGSVGPADISDAVTAAGVELAKREVRMPTGPIRQAGEYEIDVHLHSDVNTKVKITIIGEE